MAGTFSWKNVIKRTLQVCAGIVVVVLVAVGGVFAFVSTRKGQDFVVPRAVSFVNGTIVGKITLQQLRFSWSGRVEAKGMALYDLKGRRAVAVDALGVRISPAALLHHIISLSDLSVEGLAVDARKEADSWNIVDAVALRKPSPKTDTSSDLKIEIGDALLAASVLSVSVPENDILVRNVSMKFRGAYAPKEWNVDLSSLTLDLEKPLARHFATAIHANGDQDNIHAPEIVVSSPGIELAANGSFVLSTQATDFTISRLAVQPVFLAAIAQLEVHQSLMATAHAVGTLGKLKAALNLDAGKGGTVSVQASGNALNAGPFDVEADARKINITALLGGSPQPVLDAHIKLSQAGKDGAAIEIAQVTSPELSAKASGSIFKRGTGWHPILNASAVARAPVNGHAELKMDGSRFSVNSVVDVSKGLRTSFSTNGSYSADFSQINVSNIALGIPHSRWKSRGTAVLRLKPVLSVTGLDLSSGSQRIKADGRYGPRSRIRLVSSVAHLQLAQFAPFLPANIKKLAGELNANARIGGTLEAPGGEAQVQLKKGAVSIQKSPAKNITLDNISANTDVRLSSSSVLVRVNGNILNSAFTASLNTSRAILSDARNTTPFQLRAGITRADVSQLILLATDEPPAHSARGALSVSANVEGTLRKPAGSVKIDLLDGGVDDIQNLRSTITAEISKWGETHIRVDGSQQNVDHVVADLRWTPHVAGEMPMDLATLQKGSIIFDADIKDISFGAKNKSVARATLTARGTLDNPTYDVVAAVASQFNATDTANLDAKVHYQHMQANLDATASSGNSNTLHLGANAQVNLSLPAIVQKQFYTDANALKAELIAHVADLSFLQRLVPGIERISGSLEANAKAAGTFGQPHLSGSAQLSNSNVAIAGIRTFGIEKLNVALAEDVLDVSNFKVRSGGDLEARAKLIGVFAENKTLDANISTHGLMLEPARYPSDTVDSTVHIQAEMNASTINTNIEVKDMRLWVPKLATPRDVQDLSANPDIRLVNGNSIVDTAAAKTAKENAKPGRTIHIALSAPKNIFIQGPDLLLELMAKLTIDMKNSVTSINGNVTQVRPGHLSLYGRSISIDDSNIQFHGENPKNADLTVDATYTATQSKVMIGVTGTLGDPKLHLTSDPPMPDFQIVSLLINGDAPDQKTAGQPSLADRSSAIAANALGGLVASKMESALFPKSPLTLNVNVQDPNERKGSVAVGKYVNPNLFVSYDRNFGADENENSNEVHFDYRLARRWSLEGFFGDAQQAGLDLLWKRSF